MSEGIFEVFNLSTPCWFFIKTAATAMLQGESQKHAMRDVDIMSDTAYRMGSKKSCRIYLMQNGNFVKL